MEDDSQTIVLPAHSVKSLRLRMQSLSILAYHLYIEPWHSNTFLTWRIFSINSFTWQTFL